MNPALCAMWILQADMSGQAEQAGLPTEEADDYYITTMRREART